jgi:hypothetical protein
VIEPTDEMVQLIYERINFWDHDDSGIREGLAAVLAIVERDHDVRPRVADAPCTEEAWSWRYFSPEQVDGYWIRCTLSGSHDEHKDAHTGLTWSAP